MFVLGKMIDITGQTFGKLTVIECVGKLDGKRYFWKCQCECGNIVIKEGSVLRSGNTKSCGCGKYDGFKKYNKQQSAETLIVNGTRFGKLQVLEAIGYKPQYKGATKNRMWYRCQCDCGNICEVSGNQLKTGHTVSCGSCLCSKGEFIIEQLLLENNLLFNKEVILPELVKETGRKLRFDFVIYNQEGQIKRLIEFDGRQHLTGPDTNYWGRTTDTLESIKERDKIKNNFCLNHNYSLVRIPYTKLETITIEDLLGDKYLIKGDDDR